MAPEVGVWRRPSERLLPSLSILRALKARTEVIKDEAIRRNLRKAQGLFWKLSLSPPGESNRTDKARLLQVLGISEVEFVSRFCSWKLSLSPPGESNRTDKARLLQVLGISEVEFVSRFCSSTHTDWRMTCTALKAPRAAEEPAPAKAKRAA